MSGREWKPGDVALIRVGTGDWEIGLWQDDLTWACAHTSPRREHEEVLVSHPLVVIDPEDREQVERLHAALGWPWSTTEKVMDALRSLIVDPKPDEPTGLGAVVEDADGDQWVRFKTAGLSPWRLNRHGALDSGSTCFYAEIAAVRVLSEGVTA